MPYGAQSVISICQRPLFVRQAERCVSLKRRCYVVCTYGACFQRFKVSPLRCFRVSKFHCFAVSMFHNSSPIGYPKVNPDSVCLLSNRGPQSKPRFYLFAMGRSGGTSCPNLGTQNKRLLYFGKAEEHVAQ